KGRHRRRSHPKRWANPQGEDHATTARSSSGSGAVEDALRLQQLVSGHVSVASPEHVLDGERLAVLVDAEHGADLLRAAGAAGSTKARAAAANQAGHVAISLLGRELAQHLEAAAVGLDLENTARYEPRGAVEGPVRFEQLARAPQALAIRTL